MTTALSASPPATPAVANTLVHYSRCPIPTGLAIGVHLGLFEEEFPAGGDVDFCLLQAAAIDRPELGRAHFSHELKNFIRHGGNIPALWARSRGADTRVIGLSFVRGPQAVLSLPDSGIHKPEDLKGKRLLLQRNSASEPDFQYITSRRTYEGALRQAGLTFDDVTLVEPDLRPASSDGSNRSASGQIRRAWYTEGLLPLIRGEADVITSRTIGAPAPQMEFLFGLNRVFDLQWLPEIERANNSTPLTLTVDAKFIESQRGVLVRIVRRILRAEDWARAHHQEAVRFIAREQAVAEQIIESALGDALHDGIAIDFQAETIAALKDQEAYLLKQGVISESVDVDAWIDTSILEEARAANAAQSVKSQ